MAMLVYMYTMCLCDNRSIGLAVEMKCTPQYRVSQSLFFIFNMILIKFPEFLNCKLVRHEQVFTPLTNQQLPVLEAFQILD